MQFPMHFSMEHKQHVLPTLRCTIRRAGSLYRMTTSSTSTAGIDRPARVRRLPASRTYIRIEA